MIPGGNLGNVSALGEGLRHDARARADHAPAAHRRARRPSRRTRSTCPTSATSRSSSRSRRGRRWRPRSRSATRSRSRRRSTPLQRYDGIVEQASEAELAEACAHADRTACSTARTPASRSRRPRKLVERGVIRKSDRVVVISTAHGLKFVDFKVKYHSMTLEDIAPELPNPPIELPGALRHRARRDAAADRTALRQLATCSPESSRRSGASPRSSRRARSRDSRSRRRPSPTACRSARASR